MISSKSDYVTDKSERAVSKCRYNSLRNSAIFRFVTNNSWWIILLGLFTYLAIAGQYWNWNLRETNHPPPDEVRRKLRAIAIALQVYHHEYGVMPYSAEGPEAALYLLKKLIYSNESICCKLSDFDLDVAPKEKPYWDDAEKKLRNADIEYLNEKNSFTYHDIPLIVAKRSIWPNVVFLGFWDGSVTGLDAPPGYLERRSVLEDWEHYRFALGFDRR